MISFSAPHRTPRSARRRAAFLSLLGLALASLGLGCSDSPSSDDSGAGGATAGGGGAPAAAGQGNGGSAPGGATGAPAKLGGFTVNVGTLSPVSSVSGRVLDGEEPQGVLWNVKTTVGTCKLATPSAPFCDPACGQNVCAPGNRCVPRPNVIDVGTVTVTGIGDGALQLSRNAQNVYVVSDDVTIPHPPAPDGGAIRVAASGGALGAFNLESEGISPLSVTSGGAVEIKTGQPVDVRWTSGQSDLARVQLELNLARHGGQKGKITCDVPDSGSASIPEALVAELIGLGVAGFPTISITRVAAGSASVSGGTVELVVRSSVDLDVTVPGLVSCADDTHCPDGQTCQDDQQCK